MPKQVETLSLQHMENIEKKRKIGGEAASMISDWDTIILDAGSTTTEIAHNLLGHNSLTIITTALNIALMLGAVPGTQSTCREVNSRRPHYPSAATKRPSTSRTC